MKIITKILAFLIVILVAIYALFPLWIGWLISAKLPAEFTLQSFESSYPGFQKITIQQVQLNSNKVNVVINDLQIDYGLAKVTVGKIQLQIDSPQTEKQPLYKSISLPIISLSDLQIIDTLTNITIKQLEINNQNKQYYFSQVAYETKGLGNSQLSFYTADFMRQNEAPLLFIANLRLANNQLKLIVQSADKQLVTTTYRQDGDSATLQAELNIENIVSLLPLHLVGQQIQSSGLVFIDWTQNPSTQKSNILVKLVADNKLQSKFNAEMASIEMTPTHLTLNTELILEPAESEQQIFIENTTFKLSGDTLQLSRQQPAVAMTMNDYIINGSIANVLIDVDNIEDSHWTLSALLETSNLEAVYFRNPVAGSNEGVIKSLAQAELSFNLNKDKLYTSTGKLTLSNLEINGLNTMFNGQLKATWNNLAASLSAGEVSVIVESNHVESDHISELALDSLKFNSEINLQKETINGDGELFINQQLLTPYSFEFNKERQDLSIDLKQNKLANQLFNHYLSPWGKSNNTTVTITDGTVIHSGEISLTEQLSVQSQFKVEDLFLQFGDNNIQGINIEQQITSFEPLKLHSTLSIDSIHFSSGLEISDLQAKVDSYADNVIEVNSLSATILQGQLLSDSIRFGADGFEVATISLKQISLTELIFFMDISGLYAEGKIDFTLPIKMDSGSFTIDEGTFKATEKGIIKYSTAQSGSEGDENIALKALNNFHYQALDGKLSYNKLGEYRIRLHLLGANPDLYDGYPIDFVLNLKGKLSGVFQSLFLTGNFQQAVLEQIKSSQLEQ